MVNTNNNFRRRQSQNRIQKAFVQLAQTKPLHAISVTEICKAAKVNRSTFYANYFDVYDLADTINKILAANYIHWAQYEKSSTDPDVSFLYLFRDVKANQLLYKTYFNLGGSLSEDLVKHELKSTSKQTHSQTSQYDEAFFQAGTRQVIKLWLDHGCEGSPEEMYKVIQTYRPQHLNIDAQNR